MWPTAPLHATARRLEHGTPPAPVYPIALGGLEVIAEGFKIPAAANIDPQNRDNVYVVDTGTGNIWSESLTSKAKKLVASMKPGLDNLAFDSRGRLFVTSMTDNGIYLVDKQTGGHRTIVEGVPAKGMPSWGKLLPREKVDAVTVYVLSLAGTNPPNPKAPLTLRLPGSSSISMKPSPRNSHAAHCF